jgi:hypothetical protein
MMVANATAMPLAINLSASSQMILIRPFARILTGGVNQMVPRRSLRPARAGPGKKMLETK